MTAQKKKKKKNSKQNEIMNPQTSFRFCLPGFSNWDQQKSRAEWYIL